MTRQVSGFCRTGVKMKLWNFRETDVCPFCDIPEENLYVVRCKSISANNTWSKSLQNLEEILLNNHTPPTLVAMITNIFLWQYAMGTP